MAEISYAYIQVDGDGAVQNIAMFENYEDANRITRAVYGDQAFAAEYRYAVRPGGVDRFHDGRFWTVAEDGTETEAEYIPTEQDKINAYMTLYTALVTISKAAAPMIPFMTEEIYQNLVRSIDKTAPESIHLCDFPTVDEAHIDAELEAKMDEVLKIVVMGRAARNTANIKNRQPIAKMFVKAPEKLPEFYQEIIEDELNVKSVEFTDDVRSFTSYTFKPQLKTVGPKYGKQLGNIKKALTELDGNTAMDTLNEKGALTFNFDGNEVVLTKDDLLIDMAQTEGYVSEADNTVTVVLDTTLTPELLEEGFYREIVSKIQTMRKEAGFEVMDHIYVYADKNEKIADLIKKYADELKSEVMADNIMLGEMAGYTKEWNINGEDVVFGVVKVTK